MGGPNGPSAKPRPLAVHVWLLGIAMASSGAYTTWNTALVAGLSTYIVSCSLVGVAYVALCCCQAEITGALPFGGGSYGVARCTLGFFPAYLVGCCETLAYITCLSATVVQLARVLVEAMPLLSGYEPLLWLGAYACALLVFLRGSTRVFWVFSALMGIVSLVTLLVVCVGGWATPGTTRSRDHISVPQAQDDNSNTFQSFIKTMPLSAWFFLGLEALNLATDHVDDPKRTIPRAQIACALSLIAMTAMVVYVCVASAEDIMQLATQKTPMTTLVIHTFPRLDPLLAKLVVVPPMFGSAVALMWPFATLLEALALSRLLPQRLAVRSIHASCAMPPVALVVGTVVSYVLCLLDLFVAPSDNYLVMLALGFASVNNAGQSISYMVLRLNSAVLRNSTFRSPLGVPGAALSTTVWLMCMWSIAAFQGNGGVEAVTCMCLLLPLAASYMLHSRHQQIFSDRENKVLLIAHIVNFNAGKYKRKAFMAAMNDSKPHTLSPRTPLSNAVVLTTSTRRRRRSRIRDRDVEITDLDADVIPSGPTSPTPPSLPPAPEAPQLPPLLSVTVRMPTLLTPLPTASPTSSHSRRSSKLARIMPVIDEPRPASK